MWHAYLQWCARSGLMLQHLGHLYTTWPGFSCKLSMNSLVAFPLGTAPWRKEERRQGWPGVPAPHSQHSHFKGAVTHAGTRHSILTRGLLGITQGRGRGTPTCGLCGQNYTNTNEYIVTISPKYCQKVNRWVLIISSFHTLSTEVFLINNFSNS